MPKTNECVLREKDREEIDRLGFQHHAWKEETDSLIHQAGFKNGDKIADIGSGPGYVSMELADIVGLTGKVTAVDNSQLFTDHILEEARRKQLSQLGSLLLDLRTQAELLPDNLDGIFIRWVLMFLPNINRILHKISQKLKPGGKLAIMEYFNFHAIGLYPEGEKFEEIYSAVFKLLKMNGGDPDIGLKLPAILHNIGFKIEVLDPHIGIGRPGDLKWQWLERNHPHHYKLASEKLIPKESLDQYFEEWTNHSKLDNAFILSPPLMSLVAVKL